MITCHSVQRADLERRRRSPIFGVLNHIAVAVPALRQPALARHVATLLVATFLRVYAAERRHLGHPLDGQDPDVLRVLVEEQRERARAEARSVCLFREATHAEYAMPGSSEAFVRTFRRSPRLASRDAVDTKGGAAISGK